MSLYSDDQWRAVVVRRDAERLERLRRAAAERSGRRARAAAGQATALPPLDARPEREVRRAHERRPKRG